jgi:hypothetical protein
MEKQINYRFAEENGSPDQNCPIEITDGKYKGIVYTYGTVKVEELPNEQLNIIMDVSIIKAPKDFDKESQEFTNTVGQIFADIVENNTAESIRKEPIDLEDDVHIDN